ncbi:E3 SUMO-protein ligase MMS21-like isoform X2 [Corylus avellana]|uniref:E3 SUMO-protein ligase MMS21-like isoform X2 n=1 Tax=Corylus avellana TaxID=13451 RepID=UPI00286C9646|nr:E3 SUMO-protein ligase MMS21-like isoform X2 [Corylus avellana]
MASTSASRSTGVTGRIQTAASTLYSDNQSLIAVKELENAAVEFLATYEDCTHFSSAIHSVGDRCQPVGELTNFKKLFEDEIAKLKASSLQFHKTIL